MELGSDEYTRFRRFAIDPIERAHKRSRSVISRCRLEVISSFERVNVRLPSIATHNERPFSRSLTVVGLRNDYRRERPLSDVHAINALGYAARWIMLTGG